MIFDGRLRGGRGLINWPLHMLLVFFWRIFSPLNRKCWKVFGVAHCGEKKDEEKTCLLSSHEILSLTQKKKRLSCRRFGVGWEKNFEAPCVRRCGPSKEKVNWMKWRFCTRPARQNPHFLSSFAASRCRTRGIACVRHGEWRRQWCLRSTFLSASASASALHGESLANGDRVFSDVTRQYYDWPEGLTHDSIIACE